MLYVLAMNIRPLARRALTSSPIALLAVLAFSGSAGATVTSQIEGVWSFSGGAVVIGPGPSGTLQGTVVSPTTFASCVHPTEQVMWTDMQEQSDGSFWGLHFWYQSEGSICKEDAVRGHTAWRVLTNAAGERILKVCFNTPSSGSQPTIAASGKEANVTFGCTESKPLAPPPTVEGEGTGKGNGPGTITFSKTVVLPPPTGCVSQTSLKISLKNPKFDPLKEVVVKIGRKTVADVKGVKRLKKSVTLKKLPTGAYKISVVATTVLNQRLTGSQTYKSCTKGSGKIKLKRVKAHHA
jgi:hypothetical protein